MYIQMISIHGLIRGNDVEMGRDADTGGQVRYVLDQARALSRMDGVDRVDVFTRQIRDKRISADYAQPVERLTERARIVRLPCGGGRYVRKERLWPLLDEYVDRMISFTRKEGKSPAIVAGHYADAGYAARHMASTFGVPFVFFGHSLGRNKLAFLLEQGWPEERIDKEYSMRRRIAEEEAILAEADLVVCSTEYEREHLYGPYRNGTAPRFAVIAPGLDLARFFPYYYYDLPGESIDESMKQARVRMLNEMQRFHFQVDKPVILALCRPEKRKNIHLLIETFGRDPELQAIANLAVFAGIRRNIAEMNEDEQAVLTDMLLLMDRYDLYGHMAIPKRHDPLHDVPEMYRIAAAKRGVFANPTVLETFGLTFIEASACGLPFVGSNRGGPRDIVRNCDGGILVDVSDQAALSSALKRVLTDSALWDRLSANGINGITGHYSWEAHSKALFTALDNLRQVPVKTVFRSTRDELPLGRRLGAVDYMLATDLDDTLLGDDEALARFIDSLAPHRDRIALGIATGRSVESARAVLEGHGIDDAGIYITSVGTEIYYGPDMVADRGWSSHIRAKWKPERVREVLGDLPFLELQAEPGAQREFKISYHVKTAGEPEELLSAVRRRLAEHRVAARPILSHGVFIDVLPYRASKGRALRFLSAKWNIPLTRIVAAGNSGNDRDMLSGSIAGIVVANHEPELEGMKSADRVYFASASYADGILEGLQHYGILESSPASGVERGTPQGAAR